MNQTVRTALAGFGALNARRRAQASYGSLTSLLSTVTSQIKSATTLASQVKTTINNAATSYVPGSTSDPRLNKPAAPYVAPIAKTPTGTVSLAVTTTQQLVEQAQAKVNPPPPPPAPPPGLSTGAQLAVGALAVGAIALLARRKKR